MVSQRHTSPHSPTVTLTQREGEGTDRSDRSATITEETLTFRVFHHSFPSFLKTKQKDLITVAFYRSVQPLDRLQLSTEKQSTMKTPKY